MRILLAAAFAGVITAWITGNIFASLTASALISVVLFFVARFFPKDVW
jgi:hypothetical protein